MGRQAEEGLEVVLAGEADTRAAGAALGAVLAAGDAVALVGDLGAGKTTLVQGIALGAGVPPDEPVTSPTFTLLDEHAGRIRLVHADLYRIERERELDQIGLDDAFRTAAAVLVEWADRFPVMPADHLRIELTLDGEDARRLVARGTGPRGAALVAAWTERLAC
jgi:tRNA threonylcarbamoyladenosine biosynthesis protein TsaE